MNIKLKPYNVRQLQAANKQLHEAFDALHKEFEMLRASVKFNVVDVYSSESDICVGMSHKLWHRIVCKYDGNVCIGTPNPHWNSTWQIREDGFHIIRFVDENWNGWYGPYDKSNKCKFHQLPKAVVNKHHAALVEHMKTNFSLWYPAAIWDDINGNLHCP